MNKYYERELPEGYKEVYVVDATTTRFTVIANLAAFAIMLAIGLCAYFIIQPQGFKANYSTLRDVAFILLLFMYIVLHELVHGAAYKLLTKEKLSFGFTASVAFCGVPNIYVYRKTAMISLLSPFVVFSVIFIAMACLLPNAWNRLYAMFLFAVHFGGCVGDLYDSYLYVVKFKDPTILMRDSGPKQFFYAK